MDSRTKLRFRQYMVQGKSLYLQHCANCHGQNGEGLAKLMPPLAKSDYLMADVERAACLIRHGLEGPIQVNGEEFNQRMEAHTELKDLQIAEIVTFITNSWGNENGLFSSKQATITFQNCPETDI